MNSNLDKVKLSLIKRKRQEALFRFYGLIGIISAILFLIIILYSVISQGQKAFFTTFIKVDVYFDSEIIDLTCNLINLFSYYITLIRYLSMYLI